MGSIDPTTPIIAVGIIVALLLFCGYAIFTRQSTDDDQDENSSTRPIDPGRSRGLDSTLIETFPTFIYSEVKHLMIGKGAMECAVCLNEFEDIETLKLLPKCDHVFHSECIGKWLSSRTTCPVCRDDLAVPDAHEQAPVVYDTSAVDRSSITIEVAEESIVDEGGWKKSTNWSKFPRSHSTGHSLVQPGESVARFTLKLPDEIRNEIMTRASNQTTTSRRAAAGGGGGEGSSRGKSYRRLGSLDRPDRWMFNMALPMKLSKSNRLMLVGKNYDASLSV